MLFGLDFSSPIFWSAFGSILLANIVLSGDNAVVIAMAARTLQPAQRSKAIFWGSAAAIVMRIVLTIVAIQLLTLPYLKLIGAVLLVYIGVDLLRGEEEGDGEGKEINGMAAAIRTILIADLVMSLDNVLAVAAAAKGNVPLLVMGLLVSIPLIIFGATLLTKVMERMPSGSSGVVTRTRRSPSWPSLPGSKNLCNGWSITLSLPGQSPLTSAK